MIRNEEDTIREATEELKVQKQSFERADESYTGFIAKQIPAEPAITSKDLKTEMITQHLLQDPKLAGIIDLQAEGVAQSLCALLNLIVEGKKTAEGGQEEGSEMDLDEAEIAAKRDHENAVEQMEGTPGKAAARRRARKKAQEQSGGSSMDTAPEIRNEMGKRDAEEAGNANPPPKLQQLPQNPEQFDLTKGDGDKEDKTKEAASVAVPTEKDE